MKKIFLLFISACIAFSAMAQDQRRQYAADSSLSRWVIDVNFLGGGFTQNFTAANTAPNYLNGLNINTGDLGFKNGVAYGGDAQLGFFFGHKRHWGIGTGLLYLRETGNVTLDNFHAEYQSVDANGYTFRQVVTGDNVNEKITSDNFNIPLLLKYKNRFSKHWGFTADAGILFNLQMANSYNTNATFDYEAIYKFITNDGVTTPVYDNSPVPANGDFLITKTQYIKNNPDGNVQDYFNEKRNEGYTVGLGVSPNTTKGKVSYAAGSVGLLVQPSVNYFFSDHVALNLGAYYMYQPFTNTKNNANYQLTTGPGDYSSVLNSVTHSNTQSYGINVGLRFFLGKKRIPPVITSVDQVNPSACGLCDGAMILHGLFANEPVTVNYVMNGASQPAYTGTVDGNNTVKLSGLCAGTYSGITATVRKGNATTTNVTLTDPVMRISSQNSTNPTANGACDGSITLYGLYAGRQATINYNLNGNPQPSYTAIVNSDNSITLSGLCAGAYSSITAKISNCTANGSDVTLTAPAPPPPPPPPAPVEKIDISTPLLFDFNKATIHHSSYPVLDEAYKELEDDNNTYIRVDGHTDAIGSQAYNQKLSVERAMAVKTFLKKKGIKASRIKVYGHGKKQPAASNKTPEGRSKNRRAIMKLEYKK